MAELFKGQAGSPITNLTASMTISQTTATVADANALPDAPNICTIGLGDNLETIRYGAKSGGSLSEITRGIEGTPRAWQVGTEVARFFTAYDHQAIIDNCITIVEKSSNENGKYTKYSDGTMICTMSVSTSPTDHTTIPFPANFKDTMIYFAPTIITPAVISISCSLSNETTSSVNVITLRSDDTVVATALSLVAIGRWK